MAGPLVSIVTSTYNRSNVLRYTMGSVRASTLTNWEHIIVGDHCTDDTAEVVASYGDSRITFRNLDVNCGEQSGPNNAGLRLATGRYVAMLNHDDLWLPSHLAVATETLERTGADLVFTLTLVIDGRGRPLLSGVTRNDRYERGAFVPCSSWVFKRELFDDIGEWRSARTLHAVPSSDWIDRAHRAGKLLVAAPVVTNIAIQSGHRRGSYAEREVDVHATLAHALATDPNALASLLTTALLDLARAQRGVTPLVTRAARNAAVRTIASLGIQPAALLNATRYGRRGGFVDELRTTRGLPPLPRRGHDA